MMGCMKAHFKTTCDMDMAFSDGMMVKYSKGSGEWAQKMAMGFGKELTGATMRAIGT